MFSSSKAYTSFSVNDLKEARRFYGEILGLGVSDVADDPSAITLSLPGGAEVICYEKPDHEPAKFTIFNFQVPDVDQGVDELTRRDIAIERYDGLDQDDKGIYRGGNIAWFKDPAGNILSVCS